MTDLPTFEVTGERIVTRNPRTLVRGLMVAQEAFIEIDATCMRQAFLKELMFHIGQKHIVVKVAE